MKVYFVDNKSGYVKIGRSKDPSSRLRQLQTANPCELEMFYIEDVDEFKVHELFKSLRVRETGEGREWFRKKGNLKSYMEGYKDICLEGDNVLLVNTRRKKKTLKKKPLFGVSMKHILKGLMK